MIRPLRRLSWIERLFVAVIGVDIALVLAGPFVVPATFGSPAWVGSTFGDVAMQLALAALALAGPWSFRRQQGSIGINMALGLAFAALYVSVIVLEFQGVQTGVNIVALFVGVAFVAGASVTYRTRHWLQGLLAAIFGILLVNVTTFRPHPATLQSTPWTGLPDRIAEWGILFLAAGKVWPMLAFLFGLGFALQLGRARAGTPVLPRYTRRLTALLAIGLLHNALLWDGDILVNYALIGFLLLPFARRHPRTVLLWAVGLLAAFVGLIAVAALVAALQGPARAAAAPAVPAPDPMEALWRTGSYGALLTARLGVLAGSATENLGGAPIALAVFLTGLYAGQRGILTHPEAHLPLLRRATRWAVPVGLAGALLFTLISVAAPPVVALPIPARTPGTAAAVPGVLALSLVYVAGLTLLLQQPRWQARLAPLAAVGRMALTNYLLQSLVCTTLFYGYGLG